MAGYDRSHSSDESCYKRTLQVIKLHRKALQLTTTGHSYPTPAPSEPTQEKQYIALLWGCRCWRFRTVSVSRPASNKYLAKRYQKKMKTPHSLLLYSFLLRHCLTFRNKSAKLITFYINVASCSHRLSTGPSRSKKRHLGAH